MTITCEFCSVLNPDERDRCMACGAALPILAAALPPAVVVTESLVPLPETLPPLEPQPLGEQLKEGAKVAGSSLGLLGVGTLILRAIARAIAIAVSAFIIGLNAGMAATETPDRTLFLVLAAVGGALLGLAVRLARKRVIFTLLSAPIGALLGSILAVVLSLNIKGQPWSMIFSTAGGVVLALLGGHARGNTPLPWFQRARPLLGVIGGLLFGMLGFAAGFRIY